MKTSFFIALLCTLVINVSAQTASNQGTVTEASKDTPYTIVLRDADSRVWERTAYERNSSSETVQQAHRYTELATGMHYLKGGQWLDSQEKIEIQPQGGAAATQGQHQVYFPYDIYDGAIELVTPDGKHLKSRPLEIAYSDGTKTIMIAELKHSIGQILPSGNQVIYTNAFTDFAADLVCTYRKSGFESDLVFREQPPTPDAFGLNSQTSRLELLTEFFDTPEPEQTKGSKPASSGVQPSRVSIADPENLSDVTLKFGTMTMVHGKAFSVDSGDSTLSPTKNIDGFPGVRGQLAVDKAWTQMEGRTFLIEAVSAAEMNTKLKGLPISNSTTMFTSSSRSALRQVSYNRLLPPIRTVRNNAKSIPLAKAALNQKPGFVLDYLIINSDQTDFTFRGDTTYYVSEGVYFSGNVILEGGTIIKFPANNNAFIYVNGGTITCKTGPYRPAIFTSRDDNSVGDTITGSTGVPGVGDYACLVTQDIGVNIHDLRMSYGYWGAYLQFGDATLSNLQILHSQIGIQFFESTHCSVRNVLMSDIREWAFEAYDTSVDLENLTLDQCQQFGYNDFNSSLQVTNCIFTGVQTMPPGGGLNIPYVSNCVAVAATNSGIFQTLGAGNYYLADNSAYRNAGTTNINPSLLADLRQKTTYPPILYTNIGVSINTTLNPQAQRDTDVPDLGYHYDPIDYLVDNYEITNATLTVSPGTAIASYGDSAIVVTDGSTITSIGTVLSPIWYTRYFCVQEEPMVRGSSPSSSLIVNPFHLSAPPIGQYRFCKFSTVGNMGYFLYHNQNSWSYSNLLVQDCEFWDGANNFGGYNNANAILKNNLFVRSTITAQASGITNVFLVASNNLFWNGTFSALPFSNSNSWIFFNNAFDHSTNNVVFASQNFVNGHNAYIGDTNVTMRLMPIGSSDVVVTNFIYQIGLLGDFYQLTNSILINTGSVTADLASLYHYTTTTNQVKETNSVVDIGYHYVAVDSSGNPIDSDGDGMPDYLEDANGNGSVDSGETDWQGATDLGLKVLITRPRENSVVP